MVQTAEVWNLVSGDPYGEYLLMEAAAVSNLSHTLTLTLRLSPPGHVGTETMPTCNSVAAAQALRRPFLHAVRIVKRTNVARDSMRPGPLAAGAGQDSCSQGRHHAAPGQLRHGCRLPAVG